MVEYKVISDNEPELRNRLKPEKLEGVLNDYASQGWRVVSAFNTGLPMGTVTIILEAPGR
jgi:hypothetical protein